MKYIRTKDGIYECIWEITEINGKNYINVRYDGILYREEILKQADTIEELCDGYIVESKNNPAKWFEMTCEEYGRRKPKFNNWIIYAYIKTDKGLIYVAKMNDTGELELL